MSKNGNSHPFDDVNFTPRPKITLKVDWVMILCLYFCVGRHKLVEIHSILQSKRTKCEFVLLVFFLLKISKKCRKSQKKMKI